MKIALIRRQFAATGGAELYLQRLLQSLAAQGHELSLFAEKWDAELPPKARLHLVQARATRSIRGKIFAEGVDFALKDHKFDCVFSLERTLRQDVYRAGDGVHACWLDQRKRFAPWWRKPFIGLGGFHRNMLALERRTFDPSNTRLIIVNSEMVGREIVDRFRFPAERIHLIRNGVQVARFRGADRPQARRRFGFADRDFVLLFVGSGWERKGLGYALEAFRTLCGEAANPSRLKMLVVGKGRVPANVPDGVAFAGAIPEVEQAYAASDLFILLPIYEPSANVTIEALAAGLPVITTRQNGASETLEEGVTGSVLERPDDAPKTLAAVKFWMDRPRPRPLADFRALSLERNVEETVGVLEKAAALRAGKAVI